MINAVTETTQKGQVATTEFLWLLAEQYGMDFPQVIDPQKSLYKYANSTSIGLPFSVAVDLRTMKIVHAKSGKSDVSTIEQLATQTLGP